MAEDRFAEGYAVGRDNNCGYNQGGFGFGGEWGGLIGLLIVASLFGNGGWGIGGNRCGGSACATQADLANGFAQNTLQRGIDDIILNQATAQNFTNQGFAGVNATVNTVGTQISQGLCNLGYNLSHQIADCCCTTQRAIDGVNYNLAKSTCDIIQAGNANTQRLLDYFNCEKISSLQAQNAALTAQLSQNSQTATLLNAINRTPTPAYVVPNPYCGGYGYGYGRSGDGCGCGCGC